ncbi:MAG: sigma-54 dependent transcriptional regulator [Gammaproteobacteria bacterium]|nr:sigma-54 dependent transcriptional regulator [Gammaproteobacteria bacterium]
MRRIIVTEDAVDAGFDLKPLSNRGYEVVVTSDLSRLERSDEPASLVLNAEASALSKAELSVGALAQKGNIDRLLKFRRGQRFCFNLKPNGVMADAVIAPEHTEFQTELLSYFLQGVGSVAAGDPKTLELLALSRRVARSPVTVMVNGPTGTGKEVIAQYLHRSSGRAEKPFVAVNCAAVPDSMLEAILFGYERGAFTGAYQPNKGIFRTADEGTLLLDEISEMALSLQAKLLRVLQEREVTPIGGSKAIPIDVRVIATSNRNMHQEVRNGTFREDLYYRLNVFPLHTVALRDRRGDIGPITAALMVRHAPSRNDLPTISDEGLEKLRSHDWPGNVRELENVVQRALLLSDGGLIDVEHILFDTPESPVVFQTVGQPLSSVA